MFYSRLLAGLRVPFLVGQRDRYASWRCACRELRYRRLIIAFIFWDPVFSLIWSELSWMPIHVLRIGHSISST